MQDNDLSTRVKKILFHFEETAATIERGTGLASNTFRNMLHGKTQKIYVTTIVALLDHFPSVDANWLLTGRGEMLKKYSRSGHNSTECLECISKDGEIRSLRHYNEVLLQKTQVQATELGKIKQQLADCLGKLGNNSPRKKAV